jgi:1-acyl-sn-glycerol-3-phosphate acyltransferase
LTARSPGGIVSAERAEGTKEAMLSYAVTWPIMKALLRTAFRLCGGIRREGQGGVPRSGGVLVCPNHFSDADPAAVAITLPRRGAYFMAKEELFSVPVLGFLMKLFRGFPVKRNSADRAALRRAEELLAAGETVVIFPEGGGNAEGRLQPLNPGALMVALRAKVPVVPVALVNTDKVWPYGDPRPRRAGVTVTVTYGEPLDLSDLYGKRGAVEEATRRLTERLASMLGQPVPQGKPRNRREEDEQAREGESKPPSATPAPAS